MKIGKPGRLAVYTSALIVAVAGLVCFFLYRVMDEPPRLRYIFIFLFILLVIVYTIIQFIFNKYFYDNIKLIYKNILQLRLSRSRMIEKSISEEEIVPEINRILIDWEKEQKEEID